MIPQRNITIKRFRIGYFDRICAIQVISMFLVTIHATCMPFLVRIANQSNFFATSSVCIMEVLKLAFCVIMIIVQQRSFTGAAKNLYNALVVKHQETMRVSIPAFFYAIQNNLYYIALQNIDATTYSVTIQLRILTTALLFVVMLSRRLSWQQWVSQIVVLLGVVLVQMDKGHISGMKMKNEASSFLLGISCVIGMCWTSAFAGVYFEKILKDVSDDVWIQNIRLSIMTLFFASITMATTNGDEMFIYGFWRGWTPMVWLVTAINSIGGICISFVMKYSNNILKTYCQSTAIGLTSLIAILIGERSYSPFLLVGIFLVMISIYIYSAFPHQNKYTLLEDDSKDCPE